MNNFISEDSQVGSNVGRVAYALEQLNEHNIEYTLQNASTGHVRCRRKSDDRLVHFWASTGKIYDAHSHYGDTERGILALIKYLER